VKIPTGDALSPLEAEKLVAGYAAYVEDLHAQIDEMMLAQAWRDGLRPERGWRRPKRRVGTAIAGLRPEFDRLLEQGLSARRAAEFLGKRTGYNPETIRKRFR
jgi:hypothetical protein